MKTARSYHEIVDRRPKAVRVLLEQADRNAVWFPLHRVELDEDAKTIAATAKLWEEKDPARARDFGEEKRAEREAARARECELLPLAGARRYSEKSIVVDGSLDEECSDQEIRRRFFFPLSQCEEKDVDGEVVYHAPAWLIEAKAAEAIFEWVSNRGRKGVDHLGGALLQAHFGSHSIPVNVARLRRVRDRGR